jgi:hypothetical protein
MSDNGITSIVFLPVCSKCLNIIWQTVDCEARTGIACGSPRIIGEKYDLTPEQCPHCRRFIDSITIPTKLPFNGSEYMEGRGNEERREIE